MKKRDSFFSATRKDGLVRRHRKGFAVAGGSSVTPYELGASKQTKHDSKSGDSARKVAHLNRLSMFNSLADVFCGRGNELHAIGLFSIVKVGS
jgi:hypothetical protein